MIVLYELLRNYYSLDDTTAFEELQGRLLYWKSVKAFNLLSDIQVNPPQGLVKTLTI